MWRGEDDDSGHSKTAASAGEAMKFAASMLRVSCW